MPNRFILLACFLAAALCVTAVDLSQGALTLVLLIALSIPTIMLLRSRTDEKVFITSVFLIALAARIGFGVFVHYFDVREFFGGDALTYHKNGVTLANVFQGVASPDEQLQYQTNRDLGVGFGMIYLMGGIYYVFGQKIFLAQSIIGFVGALIAPLLYFCSMRIFGNKNAAKFAAYIAALLPAFIIWTGQILKDGLLVFLIVVVMLMLLRLREKLDYLSIGFLVLALMGILSLRFYIFYIMMVAVIGSFAIAFSNSTKTIVRNTVILALITAGLSYFGVGEKAEYDLSTFADLERIQISRQDLAQSADSGFGEDIDVSTTAGAIAAVPRGFMYLMFAPYPWHATNLRQAITMPDVMLWWAMIPFLIIGLGYSIRNRLRASFPILLFSLILTIAYTLFQGNVGTAYRQRTQIQVFLFILIGVGWQVYRERRENRRIIFAAEQARLRQHFARRTVQQQN
jgi:hypothetical protein